MKLQVSALLFIATTWFVGSANSVCVVRNAKWPIYFWYQCSGSTADYVTDVKRAPLGLERISFTNSNIPVLKNSSFSRLGQSVKVLVVSSCGLTAIEDKAFEGLNTLMLIDLSANKLTVVKGTWFQEGPGSLLQFINLKYNQISHVEDSFFTSVSKLRVLDLSNNLLNCLPISSMSNMGSHTRQGGVQLTNNPLSWKCISDLVDWKSNNSNVIPKTKGLEITHNVTKNCVAQSPTPDPDDDFVNSCVETALNELLPTQENYTIEQLCEFWANKPAASTYLKCNDSDQL